ncbi:hypothetical protein PI124_g21538 [Phytophthora idaei]|nr:hypothetical protein PI125_g23250 [Phytophthora idaei]KAG3129104.1 hypothetical protein PI126_g21111 [Phytophthora idaei]KAG3233384.1 hypothetical protein PI124_g21538 [Phytophthora idaei]
MFEVSERQKRVLRELDLNIDALNVVNLLSSLTEAPRPQKRKRGKWIDDRYTDGDLLDYDMLLAAEKAKEAAVDGANRLKAERAAARCAVKEKKEKEKELRAKACKRNVQKAKQKAEEKAGRDAAKAKRSSKKKNKSTAPSVELWQQTPPPNDTCLSVVV